MKKLPKHHYIPVFYLKQWAPNGRLTVFKRPHDTVVATETTPKHTGYVRGLYWLEGADPIVANRIETIVMGQIDNNAAIAHQFLLRDDVTNLSAIARTAWSRFILGLVIRSPASIRNIYLGMTTPGTDVFREMSEEFSQKFPGKHYKDLSPDMMKRAALFSISHLIQNPEIERAINAMQWSIYEPGLPELRFVTSDRPVIMNNGIGRKQGHIAIPISPTKLFLAFANKEIRQEIGAMSPWEIVGNVNTAAIRGAIEMAWDTTAFRLPLMKQHLSADAKADRNFFEVKPRRKLGKIRRI